MSHTDHNPPDFIYPGEDADRVVHQLLTGTADTATERLAAANTAARAAYAAAQARDQAIRDAYTAGADTDDLAATTGLTAAQIHRIILTD